MDGRLINKSMSDWVNECEWMNKRMSKWTYESMNEWTDELMEEWKNGRMNELIEWMDEWIMNKSMSEWVSE